MQNGTVRLRRSSEYPLALLQEKPKDALGPIDDVLQLESRDERAEMLRRKIDIVRRGGGVISWDEAAWFVQLAFKSKDRDLEALIRKETEGLTPSGKTKDVWVPFVNSLPSLAIREFFKASQDVSLAGISAVPDYLRVRVPSKQLDERVQRALDEISAPGSSFVIANLNQAYESYQKLGIASKLLPVSARLESAGLDYIGRALLSRPGIYTKLIDELEPQHNPDALKDPAGFAHSVKLKLNAEHGPRRAAYKHIVASVLFAKNIDVEDSIIDLLVDRAQAEGLELAPGRTEASVLAIYDDFIDRGGLRVLVDKFVARHEVQPGRFTPAVRERMVDYLKQASINIDVSNTDHLEAFEQQRYDEYFALAYDRATQTSTDAVTATPTTGGWDFTIDTFESLEEQAIDSDNILAAGYLYYAYELGERLHVFDMPEILYLQWTYGEQLDLPQGETASLLDKLYTERSLRETKEERALAYKKTLGLGDVETLANMTVNESFEQLWGTLMEEVAEYVRKRSEASVYEGRDAVSRIPIHRAIRELQYNLTEYANGRIKAQTAKLKALFEQCMKVLAAPEIAEAFGTPVRRDVWTVLERLNRAAPLEASPNVSAIRTAAVEGNKVFQFIARFEENTVTDGELDEFLRAAEAWIIAKASDAGSELESAPKGEESEDDELGEIDDEFDSELGDGFDELETA